MGTPAALTVANSATKRVSISRATTGGNSFSQVMPIASRRLERDRQMLKPPGAEERPPFDLAGEPRVAQAPSDQVQTFLHLVACDELADADVRPASEGHVAPGVLALGVEV